MCVCVCVCVCEYVSVCVPLYQINYNSDWPTILEAGRSQAIFLGLQVHCSETGRWPTDILCKGIKRDTCVHLTIIIIMTSLIIIMTSWNTSTEEF